MEDTTGTLFSSPDLSEFLFNNLPSAIFIVDSNLQIKKINSSFKALFSHTEQEVLNQLCGNSLGCSFAIEQDKPCGSMTECNTCQLHNCIVSGFTNMSTVKDAYISRTFYINKKPVIKYFRIKTKTVSWNGEKMTIIAIDDVTELEQQKQQLKELANRDFLTNLLNRRSFFDIAEPIFQNALRGNITIAVALFDIDFFKFINDTQGHDAGDFVLKSISEILINNLRKADLVSRYGGEEFCLLIHCKDNENAYMVIDKLRLLVEQHVFMYKDKRIDVTISAGLTTVIEDSLAEMIKKADDILYKAKKGGRNRTEEYTRTN